SDLAFVTLSDPIRGLDQRPALSVPWMLVVPEGDLLGSKTLVEPSELRALSFVRLKEDSTSHSQLQAALLRAGIQLQHCAQVDDWDTAILFAGMGLGYTIAPAIHAERLARQDGITMVPVAGLPPVVFGWASRRWNSLPSVACAFVDAFAQSVLDDQRRYDDALSAVENICEIPSGLP